MYAWLDAMVRSLPTKPKVLGSMQPLQKCKFKFGITRGNGFYFNCSIIYLEYFDNFTINKIYH